MNAEEKAVRQALRRVVEVFYMCQVMPNDTAGQRELLLFSDRVFKQYTKLTRTVQQHARNSKSTMLEMLACNNGLPYWRKYDRVNLTYSNLFAILQKECCEHM